MKKQTKMEEIKLNVKRIMINIVNEERNTSVMEDSFTDEEDISESPALQMDSLMAIRFIVELEKYFSIEVPDEDLDMEYFKNINSIAGYVRKQQSKSGKGDDEHVDGK